MVSVFIIAILMIATTLIYFLLDSSNKNMLKKRKRQSKDFLRENVLKKRIEKLTEEKVKFSKRYAVETLCLQSGFKLSYAEFIMLSVGTALLIAFLIGGIMHNTILAIIFLFIGYAIPKQVITFIKNRRINIMERQIGSFIQMVLKRYDVTKDFGKALELTLTEFKGEEPLYSEIKQTVLEINLGTPITEALDNIARRTGNKYMGRLADYYKIASSLGTEEVRKKLLYQAYIQFEENRKAKASMQKQLSEPKREAYIMLSSIPMFAVYQIFTNDTYIDFMINTTMGKVGTAIICSVMMGCIWFINNKIGGPLE